MRDKSVTPLRQLSPERQEPQPRGRKPTNWYRSTRSRWPRPRSRPQRPAVTVTGTPASRAAPTSRARIADARHPRIGHERNPLVLADTRRGSSAARFASLCSWVASAAAPRSVPGRAGRAWRVSSQRTTSAARSSPRTRSVTSSRLPIGSRRPRWHQCLLRNAAPLVGREHQARVCIPTRQGWAALARRRAGSGAA